MSKEKSKLGAKKTSFCVLSGFGSHNNHLRIIYTTIDATHYGRVLERM